MLLTHLKQIVVHLNDLDIKTLIRVRRCDENVLELQFDTLTLYADMTKSNSTLFIKPTDDCDKSFTAAFDTQLSKRFNRTKVEAFELVNEDKILRMRLISQGAYKVQHLSIWFEFTGKYTNVILLDENDTILEALRHIHSTTSSRSVRVGQSLEPVVKANFTPKEEHIEDVKAWLLNVYHKRNITRLKELKRVKLIQLDKQARHIDKALNSLQSSQELHEKATQYEAHAQVVLANMHAMTPYALTHELVDFEGKTLTITVDKPYSKASDIAQMFFNKAKKSRQKAKYLHIERENLQNKRDYFTQVHKLIKEAQTVQAIDTLMPKQKSKNKKERQKPYEVFWFDTYKVLLGRNTKANQALLQDAKANDMWFHLKDRPSAHVLIVSDKQKIPMDIIQRAAQLCVDFTVNSSGRFSVDYTKRKEVSIQEGANVLYNKYETVIVQKD